MYFQLILPFQFILNVLTIFNYNYIPKFFNDFLMFLHNFRLEVSLFVFLFQAGVHNLLILLLSPNFF